MQTIRIRIRTALPLCEKALNQPITRNKHDSIHVKKADALPLYNFTGQSPSIVVVCVMGQSPGWLQYA